MDIKKERELHKEWYENQFPTLYELYLSGVDEAIGCFRSSEETWIAAKQQAVPDGFVVVPVEPTERMLDCAYSSISDNLHYADLENIYRAMTQEFIDD